MTEGGTYSLSHEEFDGFLQKDGDSTIQHSTTEPSSSSEDNTPLQRIEKSDDGDEHEDEDEDDQEFAEDGGGINGDLHLESSAAHGSSEDFSSELLADSALGSVDSQDEPVFLDKAEVRKSILKGKSELSKSRQKNNALKAVDQAVVNSLHSPFGLHASSKPQTASRKMASSAHGPVQRSLSNESTTSVEDDSFGRRLSSSRKLGESDQGQSITLEDMRGVLKADTSNQSALPAFCTPRRDANSKAARTLKVDAKAIFGDLSSGPTRRTPQRTRSAQTPRRPIGVGITPANRGPPPRVNSLGGSKVRAHDIFALAAETPPAPSSRAQSTGELPKPNADSFGPSLLDVNDKANNGYDTSVEVAQKWVDLGSGSEEKDSFLDGIAKAVSNGEETVSKNSSFDPVEIIPAQSGPAQSSDPSTSSRKGSRRSSGRGSANNVSTMPTNNIGSSSAPDDKKKEPLHAPHQVEKNHTSVRQQEEEEVELWTCWGCEYGSNIGEHLFCGMCGTGRDWLCPSCQHENKSSFNFCGMCGSRKGRVVIHKQQPEGFDMRVRRAKKPNYDTIRKTSSNSKSSRTPPTSSHSVASGKSSSRRTSVSNKTDGAKPRSGENGEESKEKRSSRGRGRESRSKKSREERTRSTSRMGKDGKERKSRGSSVTPGDGKKERKSDKKESDKKERKSLRPSRKASSVPPAERKDIVRDGALTKMSSVRPGITKSNSLTKLEADEIDIIPASPMFIDGADDAEKRSSKSWIPMKLNKSLKAEEHEKIVGGELGSTDHSLWRPNEREGSFRDCGDDYNQQLVNRTSDLLQTPKNLTKRLTMMGGKIGGKLFKSTELPMGDDAANTPVRFAEITLKKAASSDNIPTMTAKPQNAAEPPTPSFKKRLLGNIGWGGKSGHGKGPQELLMMPDASIDNTLEEAEDIESGNEKESDKADDPLVGLSTGLVVTAKDMRPNRPNNNQRRKPPAEVRARRKSQEMVSGPDGRLERQERPPSSKRRLPPKRAKSSDCVPLPRRRHPVEGDSGLDKRKFRSSSADVLDDKLSEAESIHSLED